MRFLGLAIACVVLIALSGVLYWSSHRKPSPAGPPVSTANGLTILNLSPASISELTIKPNSEPAVTLVRQNGGGWEIAAPKKTPADQDGVTSLLAFLAPLNAERVVGTNVSDLHPFGLDQPAVELDITEKDRASVKLLIGADTPTGSSAYAMVEGDPRIFTMLSYNKGGLNKGLPDLRDKRLLTVSADRMKGIELDRGGQDIEFTHSANGWKVVKPGQYRADPIATGTLVDALSTALMNLNQPPTQVADAAFAQGSPVATVKVTGPSGTQTLEVKKDKDKYYAKSSYAEGVYQVDPSMANELTAKLDDFRNKSVFDFSFNDPDSYPNEVDLQIEGQKPGSGGQKWYLARNGQNWWQNGKKMNAASVEQVVSALRGLTATKFEPSGFAAPEITATVTSSGGKLVEKVAIAKSGGEYLAKRTDEPTLFVLDPGKVEGLEKAAAGVRPATGSAK